ncbi:hypothetical protein [Nitrosopumilus ureiphilus]|uniref:Uncharacterized protein n=1 Tax=Nitrosopumilus ureiphilus TaxID=1470067 RepID=A0A7D5M9I0_9ARCH|nr:hypothetical protein [Nitrosopumilus ureiphilus]QLH07448.1 hypothetical protein C5F50_10490 [Nitrosopumilus ureiphilus]
MTGNESSKLSIRDIALKGTIIALIVTIPSLSTFVLVWIILDDLFLGVILGAFVHFIAMGFSLKISKKLSVKK